MDSFCPLFHRHCAPIVNEQRKTLTSSGLGISASPISRDKQTIVLIPRERESTRAIP